MIWPLVVLLVIACLWLLGWAICRMAARQDADEAHRNLARLLAEQADDRLYQARIRWAAESRAYGTGRQDDHPCVYPQGWRAGPDSRWAGGEAVMDAVT